MDKRYVLRYQGGSGGFLVAWLLQMTVQSDCFDDALKCFHHSLKDNALMWRNFEIIPPNIIAHPSKFYPINCVESFSQEIRRKLLSQTIENIISNGKNYKIKTFTIFADTLMSYLHNYVVNKCIDNGNPKIQEFLKNVPKNLEEILLEYDHLLNTYEKNIFVTAPERFIEISNNKKAYTLDYNVDKAVGQGCTMYTTHISKKGDIEYCGVVSNDRYVYATPVFNMYKNKLKLFPIESIWQGNWKEHLEKCVNKKLTPHQEHRCRTIISRWLEIQPKEIKKEFNL